MVRAYQGAFVISLPRLRDAIRGVEFMALLTSLNPSALTLLVKGWAGVANACFLQGCLIGGRQDSVRGEMLH